MVQRLSVEGKSQVLHGKLLGNPSGIVGGFCGVPSGSAILLHPRERVDEGEIAAVLAVARKVGE